MHRAKLGKLGTVRDVRADLVLLCAIRPDHPFYVPSAALSVSLGASVVVYPHSHLFWCCRVVFVSPEALGWQMPVFPTPVYSSVL